MNMFQTLSEFRALPRMLAASIEGLTETQMEVARQPGKWTIRQIVHHIGDADELTMMIVKAALGQSGCIYDQRWYPTDNSWAETLDYRHRSVRSAIEAYRLRHAAMEELLHQVDQPWIRFVLLKNEHAPDGRRITVEQLIGSQTAHARHHLDQIAVTRRVHGL